MLLNCNKKKTKSIWNLRKMKNLATSLQQSKRQHTKREKWFFIITSSPEIIQSENFSNSSSVLRLMLAEQKSIVCQHNEINNTTTIEINLLNNRRTRYAIFLFYYLYSFCQFLFLPGNYYCVFFSELMRLHRL